MEGCERIRQMIPFIVILLDRRRHDARVTPMP
jgi:hypothetical protein